MSTDVNPHDSEHARLRWRCRRGMRELDVLLGRYLDRRWAQADIGERVSFERLLAVEDDLLWRWFMGREPIVDPELAELVALIAALPG